MLQLGASGLDCTVTVVFTPDKLVNERAVKKFSVSQHPMMTILLQPNIINDNNELPVRNCIKRSQASKLL